jgi:hypothetical protein
MDHLLMFRHNSLSSVFSSCITLLFYCSFEFHPLFPRYPSKVLYNIIIVSTLITFLCWSQSLVISLNICSENDRLRQTQAKVILEVDL